MDLAQRGGNVLGHRAVHLAEEAQGQVQLFVILPASLGYAVHRIGEHVADGGRRAKGDEQAYHDKTCLSHCVSVTGTSCA